MKLKSILFNFRSSHFPKPYKNLLFVNKVLRNNYWVALLLHLSLLYVDYYYLLPLNLPLLTRNI